MTVYHYTSDEGVNSILNSQKFFPSYLNPQMDTAFGEGWYFTDKTPDTPNEELEYALWMRRETEKSRRYIAFEIDPGLLEYCRPNVYRLKIESVTGGVIYLNQNYTYNNTGSFAFKFVRHGVKQLVYKPKPGANTGQILGTIALLGLGIAAIAAASK